MSRVALSGTLVASAISESVLFVIRSSQDSYPFTLVLACEKDRRKVIPFYRVDRGTPSAY